MIEKLTQIWNVIQDAVQVKGGTWVDLFGLVMIARLLAPLKGMAPLNPSEAGVCGAPQSRPLATLILMDLRRHDRSL